MMLHWNGKESSYNELFAFLKNELKMDDSKWAFEISGNPDHESSTLVLGSDEEKAFSFFIMNDFDMTFFSDFASRSHNTRITFTSNCLLHYCKRKKCDILESFAFKNLATKLAFLTFFFPYHEFV